MLQSSARITALLIILSAGTAIPATGAPKGGGAPPGHAAAPHAAPAARAAPAPHAAAPKAATPAPAARAATPRGAPQAAARAARQQPAHASGGSRAAERQATPRAAPSAAQEQPQTTGRNRDAREQQKVVEPKPRDDAARQLREGGPGAGPAARTERNASPQNAPLQPQAAQKFQAAGGKQAISGGVLRNQAFANRSAARDPIARSLARATFQGRFFDPGWRRRYPHPIVIGWAGPLFWPYAYNDFADYTFYPYAYDTFWPYAYDDVYEGMFGSYARGYGGTYARSYDGSPARARQRDTATGRSISGDLCSGQTAGLTDWPIERIAQTIEPNDAQRAALDALRGATAKALDVLKAACPTDLPSTPTGRIEAMHQRLAAMLQAAQIVRPAMETFYQSLNDEQKARFNSLGPDEGQDQQQSRRDLSQVCGDRASGIASLPFDQIERAVRPDEPQRVALRALQDATAQAVNQLQSDCPSYRALTPVARLDAMEQRLDAMLRAVETVQPALERFYGALSDEQKERFNRLSPARG